MLSANINFSSFSPIFISFISLSYLIALARTSRSILNRASDYCFPELRRPMFDKLSTSKMLVYFFF